MNSNSASNLGIKLYKLWDVLELFRISSRMNRTKYYIFYIIWVLICCGAFLMQNDHFLIAIVILLLSSLNFYFAVKRRLNDINFSGLWILLLFFSIWCFFSFFYTDFTQLCRKTGTYFTLAVFFIGIFPGNKGINEYGEPPKALSKKYSYLVLPGVVLIGFCLIGDALGLLEES